MMAQEMQQSEVIPNVTPNGEKVELREWMSLKMLTDEMSPTICQNNDLLINTKYDFKNGNIVVLWHYKRRKVIIRRIYEIPHYMVFASDNRKYKPIICRTEKLKEYMFIGVVVNSGREIKKDIW